MFEIADCATRNISPQLLLHSFVLNVTLKSNCDLDFHLFCGSSVGVGADVVAVAIAVAVNDAGVVAVAVYEVVVVG